MQMENNDVLSKVQNVQPQPDDAHQTVYSSSTILRQQSTQADSWWQCNKLNDSYTRTIGKKQMNEREKAQMETSIDSSSLAYTAERMGIWPSSVDHDYKMKLDVLCKVIKVQIIIWTKTKMIIEAQKKIFQLLQDQIWLVKLKKDTVEEYIGIA